MITKQSLIDALVANGFNTEDSAITVNHWITSIQLHFMNRLFERKENPLRLESDSDLGFEFEGLSQSDQLRSMQALGLGKPGKVLFSVLAQRIANALNREEEVHVEGIGRVSQALKPIWVLKAENPMEQPDPISS